MRRATATLMAHFNRLATRPPMWMRVLYVPMFALVALGMASRRGWIFGAVAAVVCCGLGLAVALSPSGVSTWSRRHPVLDGSILGPLTFLAVGYFTEWPWWICLITGGTGSALGAVLGILRQRRERGVAELRP